MIDEIYNVKYMVHKVRFKFILDYIVNLHCYVRNIILTLIFVFDTLWS